MTHVKHFNPTYFPNLGWVIEVKNLHKANPRGILLATFAHNYLIT